MGVKAQGCAGWLVYVVLLLPSLALAQRDLGAITGAVSDPSGAALPGATITITNDFTGQSFKLRTSKNGGYTRPALPPGTYTVTAEAKGFRRVARQKVEVTGGGRVGVNLTLVAGDVNDPVLVTGEAPLLQDESTNLGAQLSSSTVASMPLGGQRVFTYLARLSPGIVPGESTSDANTGGFSANGVRGAGQNNYLLNGIDNNVNVIDFLNGSSYVIGPPPEAIGEMQIMTSGENAEYGRGAGGVINVNLKTGTNQLHGGVWEVLQNEKLNANSWQNNRVGAQRPVFKQNQFGGAAGGPIIKNRFFLFGDYQGTRLAKLNGAGLATFPTKAEDAGDFSGLLGGPIGTSAAGSPILQYQIYDPTTTRLVNGAQARDPFAGNRIPSALQDPAAAKILHELMPTPNQAVSGFPQNDFYYSSPGHQQQDSGDLRGDFRLTGKDSLYGSLSWQEATKSSTAILPPGGGAGSMGGNTQETPSSNVQMGYTRVWSPSIVSETRAGITRLRTTIVGPAQDVDRYVQFGIGGYDPTKALPNNGGLPGIAPSRYTSFGAGGWQPMRMYSNVRDFIQNLAVMKGSHAIKFGVELRLVQFPFAQFSDPHGDMNFSMNATAYPSVGPLASNTGDAIASFLLGMVDTGTISTTNFISSEKNTWGLYAQDDWKVSKKLTLNLGMRYELFSPTFERFGRESNFDYGSVTLFIPRGNNQNQPLPPNFAAAFPNVKVSRGQISKYMMTWDKWDFGPRFGLSWNVFAKTVLRLGFGVFYGGEENLGGDPNLGESVPFNYAVQLSRTDQNLKAIDTFAANPWFAGGFHSGWPLNVFDLPAAVNFHGMGTDNRNPLVEKWNAAIQRELPWHTTLEVAYVGNNQIHQYVTHMGNACPNFGTTDSSITCETLRPTPYIGQGVAANTFAFGNYHALTAKLEKRLSGGVEFISSYTWSHALSSACLLPGNSCAAPDAVNLGSLYANALWDIRHNFTTGFTVQLPRGWGLNGILTIRTGIPMTLLYNGCQGVWNSCRPDIVAGMDANGAPPGGRSAAQWFNTSALTRAAPLTGGNIGNLNITAPGNSTLDAALFKTFRFTERFNLQFRLEAFNAFNKTQLASPDVNFQNSSFGSITSSKGERTAQFSLRLHF